MHHCGEPKTARANAELFETEFGHDHLVDEDAGEDDIGAFPGHAGDGFALAQGQAPEKFSLSANAFKAERGAIDFVAVKIVHPAGDAGEDAGGAAGADEQDGAGFLLEGGFELRADFAAQKDIEPVVRGLEFLFGWAVAVGKFFHQADGAERETLGEPDL